MPLKPISKHAEPFQCNEKDWNTSVYKMCNNNCDKRFISGMNNVYHIWLIDRLFKLLGYQGHCPRLLHRFGETYDILTHKSLNEFTDVYRQQIINRNQNSSFSLVHC